MNELEALMQEAVKQDREAVREMLRRLSTEEVRENDTERRVEM